MRLTSKGRYAVRAMLDLTFYSNGNPVRLQEISNRQAISLHYLEQLFRKLRTGRVVKSVRGPGGGYVLSRSMDEITMRDILDCVGENINPAKDIIGVPSSGVEAANPAQGNIVVDTREFRLTRGYFENLGNIMQDYLISTTLGDLMRQATQQNIEANPAQTVNVASQRAFGAAGDSAATTTETTAATEERTAGESPLASFIRPNLGEMNQ